MGKYTTKSVYKKKKTLNLFNFLRKMRGEDGGRRGKRGRTDGREDRKGARKGKKRKVVGNDLKSG